jgi:hypothetical protein
MINPDHWGELDLADHLRLAALEAESAGLGRALCW